MVIPALLGEAVLSAVNSSLDTWDQSAGGTLIERRLIDWTADRIGLGERRRRHLHQRRHASPTSRPCCSPATRPAAAALSATSAADARRATPTILPRLRILTSECSHFSIEKSATLLGLGAEAVIAVPCDENQADAHRRAGRANSTRCRRDGLVPMAVVATAGTTDFGCIDPLPEIADLCDRARRLDARRRRLRLRPAGLPPPRTCSTGIERADSVTVDYHKSFFQPVSSSAVLVRDRATLRHVTYHADYLNPRRMVEKRIPNQVDKSIQTTRRFDALKLWLTLRIMGADARRGALRRGRRPRRRRLEPARRRPPLRGRHRAPAEHPGLPLRPRRPTRTRELSDRVNLHAREALFASGDAVVAGTVVDGRHYLKFTLLNPETTLEDIATVLDLIAEHAGRTWPAPSRRSPRASASARLTAARPSPPLTAPAQPGDLRVHAALTTSSPSASARSTSAWPA